MNENQEQEKKVPRWAYALVGGILLLVLLSVTYAGFMSGRVGDDADASGGLPEKTEDGVMFHAWNWSFDAIREKLPELAEAGFKSVQTSPVQPNKEPLTNGSQWWILYQPTGFGIGNSQLGTREQFQQLCEEAEKHGISIIVDVVANHMGNAGGGELAHRPAKNVDPELLANPDFWHEAKGVLDWNARGQVTQWGIGLPDLNTANEALQDKVIAFLNDAVALGADGFRFDAAKHIELPDDRTPSNFWPRVLGALDDKERLFLYGEVLQGGADRYPSYAEFLHLTASRYGESVRHAVGFGGTPDVSLAEDFKASQVDPSKLVTWVESHDTYANDSEESTAMTDEQLKLGWAIVASRAGSNPLFFNRPAGGGKFAARIGEPGSELWRDPDIAALNRFHNAMAGEGERLQALGPDVLLIERGEKGAVLLNAGASAAQVEADTALPSGSYDSHASAGGTFLVTNGKLAGSLAPGAIAVLQR
ncbi:alpha-amylase family glycosyl hydrolase [Paenibacillus sp. B01]|uniref:alpha-amylase family glycosyl hydrolase n=1 Tax=Paenibacillus sp. B01 TaxID=2660554 RepID=UPI001E45E88A|nr:alpha-amylase family glycosyl hydrolase [Paenibacillus sp. B01]